MSEDTLIIGKELYDRLILNAAKSLSISISISDNSKKIEFEKAMEERTNLLLLQITNTKNNEPPSAYICSLASCVVLRFAHIDNMSKLKAILFATIKNQREVIEYINQNE